MNDINFFIDWYHKEIDRRDSINNSLNIPIGLLTGLFVLFFFLFKEFKILNDLSIANTIIFYIFLATAAVMWAIVVANIFGVYNNFLKGYEYKAIPYPTELNKYYKELEKYYDREKENLEATSVYEFCEGEFKKMLSEYLNRNIENNDLKFAYLFQAKKFLIWSFIFVILSCIPFTFNFYQNNYQENIQKIEISNWSEISNFINPEPKNEQTTKKTDSTTAATASNKRRKQTDTTTTANAKKNPH